MLVNVLSQKYETEQAELGQSIKSLKAELDKTGDQSMTTDMFIATVRKYTRAKKLTPLMLNELIDYIEVYHSEKINGIWRQRLRIHYHCIGEITIPDIVPLSMPEVTVQTRKGVAISYQPDSTATTPIQDAV